MNYVTKTLCCTLVDIKTQKKEHHFCKKKIINCTAEVFSVPEENERKSTIFLLLMANFNSKIKTSFDKSKESVEASTKEPIRKQ